MKAVMLKMSVKLEMYLLFQLPQMRRRRFSRAVQLLMSLKRVVLALALRPLRPAVLKRALVALALCRQRAAVLVKSVQEPQGEAPKVHLGVWRKLALGSRVQWKPGRPRLPLGSSREQGSALSGEQRSQPRRMAAGQTATRFSM